MKNEEFINITPQDAALFRKWARENYKAFTPIKEVWHPVVRDECAKLNRGGWRARAGI